MTDEKLAENWVAKYTGVDVKTLRAIKLQAYRNLKEAFLAGKKSNDKRIAKLEKENEELKKEADFFHGEKCNYKAAFLKEVLEKNKLKKYAKLLQDICTVMGNDIYMVSAGLESIVKILWDSSEEKEGLKMVKSIENRLLEIKPQDWAEIEGW